MLAPYADDSAYFASSRRADLAAKRIQRVFDLLSKWLYKWRMAVDVSKTAALLTGSQRILSDQLRLRGQTMNRTARAVRLRLRPILVSRLPTRTKIAIYKCYIRSRPTYAAPAWFALCSKLQCQRLQAQQNVVLRTIAGAGWYFKNDVIARDLKVESLEEFVRMLAQRAFNRADAGPYTSLHNLALQYYQPTKGYHLPRDLLSKSFNEEKV
ncbi:RNA-directed DNA polymerase from mobile element jockey [Eumeta japonica]|uniref:RNA-directed DNA polymerase from mobile element jockey n=1 Tax=Eumeta variegata TaxID=151549 RepID=A0A4C1XZQ5_EUMVA|nr:RNA-directed DNA polymerase from mobile element jockey [Eumeta japonica]